MDINRPGSCARAPRDDREGAQEDPGIKVEAGIGDVVEIGADLAAGGLDPFDVTQLGLRQAADAGADAVALAVARDLLEEFDGVVVVVRRGPIRLMSPFRTLRTCGSSSMRDLRRKAPRGVIRSFSRGSLAERRTLGASVIERNLNAVKGLQSRPMRVCVKISRPLL